MEPERHLRRLLSLLGTGAAVAAVVAALVWQDRAGSQEKKEAPRDGRRNWALWGGTVQRNLVNLVEKGIPTDWKVPPKGGKPDKGKNIKWVVDLGSKGYGGPTIVDGKIYVGTNNERRRNKAIRGDKGILMCLSEADGSFLWQAVHDKLEAGVVNDWPREGICSSPVVEGDRLWYVSNRCEVICASTGGLKAGNRGVKDEKYKSDTDADIIWRLDMFGDLGVFPHNLTTCSPLIVGNILFVITANGVDEGHINIPKPNAPSFVAIDKNTGKVLWSDNSPGRNIMHGQWANPVYAEPNGQPMIIFPGGDGYLHAFTPTGKGGKSELLWKFDCNPKGSVYRLGAAGTKNDFVNTPVVWQNKLYIAVGQDPEHRKSVGHMWCIDITKKPKNKDKDLSPWSPPNVEEFGGFDPKDPRNKDSALVWHYGGAAPAGAAHGYKFGRSLSTCAVHDGLCYISDFDGFVFCFDARTGERLWEHDMEADTWSSPTWIDGHVYMGNENGEVLVFRHGRTKDLVRTVRMRGKVRATPVAVNGVLYVITENPAQLYAISTGGK